MYFGIFKFPLNLQKSEIYQLVLVGSNLKSR